MSRLAPALTSVTAHRTAAPVLSLPERALSAPTTALPAPLVLARCGEWSRRRRRRGASPPASATPLIRVLSWNVLWRALDDSFGRAAIVASIDAAATARGAVPFDFVAIVEASGDSVAGNVSEVGYFNRYISFHANASHDY